MFLTRHVLSYDQAHPTWRYLEIISAVFLPSVLSRCLLVGEGCLGSSSVANYIPGKVDCTVLSLYTYMLFCISLKLRVLPI
jgi:hypothetical protein